MPLFLPYFRRFFNNSLLCYVSFCMLAYFSWFVLFHHDFAYIAEPICGNLTRAFNMTPDTAPV